MRIKITRKAEALSRKVSELEKKLGPEYVALVKGLKDVDPNWRVESYPIIGDCS